jgi:hypothetical protein
VEFKITSYAPGSDPESANYSWADIFEVDTHREAIVRATERMADANPGTHMALFRKFGNQWEPCGTGTVGDGRLDYNFEEFVPEAEREASAPPKPGYALVPFRGVPIRAGEPLPAPDHPVPIHTPYRTLTAKDGRTMWLGMRVGEAFEEVTDDEAPAVWTPVWHIEAGQQQAPEDLDWKPVPITVREAVGAAPGEALAVIEGSRELVEVCRAQTVPDSWDPMAVDAMQGARQEFAEQIEAAVEGLRELLQTRRPARGVDL